MATTTPTRLLLLESNLHVARRLAEALGPHFDVRHRATLAAAEADLALSPPDCVLSGPDAVGALRRLSDDVPIVVRRDPRGALPEGAQDEIEREADGALVARAVRYAIERRHDARRQAELALHDALTGLPNRALLCDRIAQARARLPRSGRKLVLLRVDIDDFKLVNASLGRDAGDALLVAIADRLRQAARPCKTVAHLGGEEFAVLCHATTRDAGEAGRRVLAALAPPFLLAGGEQHVTASIGRAAVGTDGSGEELLRDADADLCAVRHSGGGSPHYDGPMRHLPLQDELYRGEFVAHFGLDAGDSTGVDMQVRRDQPEGGIAPPGVIPVAEAARQIEPGNPIRVVVCDDAPAIRALVRSTLEFDGSVEVVGEAEDGESVVAVVAHLRPDVVLLDLSMPNVDGLTALPLILEAAPWVGVVVLSGRDEAESAPRALALGAERFMAKPAGIDAIRDAVLEVGLRAP